MIPHRQGINQKVLEQERLRVFRGELFEIADHDKDIDIVAPKYWLITTGPTDLHAYFILESWAKGGTWRLYHAPVCSGGDLILMSNMNATSALTLLSTVKKDPVVTSTGTIGCTLFQGAAGGLSTTIGTERVLAPNTTYLIQFTPTANNTTAQLRALLYEVPI